MVERRGGSLNREASWRGLFGRAQGGKVQINKSNGDHRMVERRRGSFNKEASWRPSYGGAQGGEV